MGVVKGELGVLDEVVGVFRKRNQSERSGRACVEDEVVGFDLDRSLEGRNG